MPEDLQSASTEQVWTAWPRYREAVLGFRNYWYPVLFSRELAKKPRSITLCGEKIVLVRDGGRIYGLRDRCPHRGVPLSAGRCEFPGTLTCAYHGWTYDLASGDLVAALTDGPDSPIVGKASVKVQPYPVEERGALIWVYVGDAPPPPIEVDLPAELLQPDLVVLGKQELRKGNWRYAAENGIDEGHSRYLHRYALWTFFRKMPAWVKGVSMVASEDGQWLWRVRGEAIFEDIYPRIGTWPPKQWWRNRNAKSIYHNLGIRLPAMLFNGQTGWNEYQIWVPVDASHHLAFLVAVKQAQGLAPLRFQLWYWLWVRWVFQGQFNGQDDRMIKQMDIPPERLYRPDASVTAWRTFCEEHVRGRQLGDAFKRTAEVEIEDPVGSPR